MQTPEHFTLKQVTESIRKTIEQRYNRTYWVLAEMHKLNETRKGHCYPELVQKEDGMIVAEMRGTIWKQSYDRIRTRFMEVVKEPLRDGLELLFQVRIVYHPIYNLGLEIIDIDPNYALGALQRERQETLERLTKEGILNANQQLEMALVPKRLAVISQADSKGYSDFVTLLNGHPKRYHFSTFLFEATLQGDAAVRSITAQLNRIARIKHHFDAVVVIRGGGGEIGMHCYNNYELARTIATFPLPVLTGIGHSTNMTVCEMIAYNNGITPSDLAYYLLRIFEELDEPLDEYLLALPGIARSYLNAHRNEFNSAVRLFQSETKSILRRLSEEHRSVTKEVISSVKLALQKEDGKLRNSQSQLKPSAGRLIMAKQQRLATDVSSIAAYSRSLFRNEQLAVNTVVHRLKHQAPQHIKQQFLLLEQSNRQLQLVDPANVLQRGYAIVTNQQGALTASNRPAEGEQVTIQYAGGSEQAKILPNSENA